MVQDSYKLIAKIYDRIQNYSKYSKWNNFIKKIWKKINLNQHLFWMLLVEQGTILFSFQNKG